MPESGRPRDNGWSAADLEVLAANPDLTSHDLISLLPSHSAQAIGNMRARHLGHRGEAVIAEPPVKAAGDYIETVSAYLADDWECLAIWMKWNGYHTYRELSRDMNASSLGIVTLVCTAK